MCIRDRCQRYHTQVKKVYGREEYSCMNASTLGVNKVSGRGRRAFSLGLKVECLEPYCKHVGSTTDADFLRLLPREVSLQYPCDPDGAEGNLHVTRRLLTKMRTLGHDTDAGSSAVVRAELRADAEEFELATMMLDVANGKHWRALDATVGDGVWEALTPPQQAALASARALHDKLCDGEVAYARIAETALHESYGTSICSADALGDAFRRKLEAAAPVHERELQLASAASHASGDHCVPVGQAFQIKGAKDLQAYVVTSANRCETLGVYIVPNSSFASIQPALEGLGGRPSFNAAVYSVDDAHVARECTLTALNKAKEEARSPDQRVHELLQDLKHFSTRIMGF
eukprot:5467827-Prymnesium_polylepis.1